MSDSPAIASLREEFKDLEARHDYARLFSNSAIALQIKTLRLQRGWSQEELGKRAGITPGRIALMEQASFSGWNLAALRNLAEAFDLALKVHFQGFGELLDDIESLSRANFERPSFSDDPAFFHEEPA